MNTQLSPVELTQASSQGSCRKAPAVRPRANGIIPVVDPAVEWDREWDLQGWADEGPQPEGFLGFDDDQEVSGRWPLSPARPG